MAVDFANDSKWEGFDSVFATVGVVPVPVRPVDDALCVRPRADLKLLPVGIQLDRRDWNLLVGRVQPVPLVLADTIVTVALLDA